MIIEINKLIEPVHPIEVQFSPEQIGLDDENLALFDEVELKGSIEKYSYEIDVIGRIKGKARVSCDRCNAPIETALDISFKSAYVSAEYETSDAEVQVSGDELDVEFFEDDKLDLAAIVREQIILNASETALCKTDCKGLCQKCGANKNEKTCDCGEREIDPRFKVLENLSKENKN